MKSSTRCQRNANVPTLPSHAHLFCVCVCVLDVISTVAIQGYSGDLKWRFVKKAGSVGVYSATAEPLRPDETLVCMYLVHISTEERSIVNTSPSLTAY